MRHGKRINKIGRGAAHRKATLAAMSTALIQHKRITTTYTKAKALRGFVEPLINRAKSDTVHNRRQVFRRLQDKEAVTTLFEEVAEKVGDRAGGYTRVVKLGKRQGDAAEVAMIELVDYNDVKPDGASGSQKRKT
ncbi:MAG: 50S ribosomal protein L17, partial [Rhodothermia bacterium]